LDSRVWGGVGEKFSRPKDDLSVGIKPEGTTAAAELGAAPTAEAGCRSMNLVMEAVAELDEEFARIVPVEAAEGDAVVELDTAVRYVYGVQRCGEVLAEIFA
jgi:hypothetical protein